MEAVQISGGLQGTAWDTNKHRQNKGDGTKLDELGTSITIMQ